jgi:hypothetical protein
MKQSNLYQISNYTYSKHGCMKLVLSPTQLIKMFASLIVEQDL